MTNARLSPAPSIEAELLRLVVKDRVGLGGLGLAERALALALVWAALPTTPTNEPGINGHLKQALAGPACWLGTDHVELRRWMVDCGWLRRDGFGRVYERTLPAALAADLQPLAAALDRLDVAAWVVRTRQQHRQARAARQTAWQRQA